MTWFAGHRTLLGWNRGSRGPRFLARAPRCGLSWFLGVAALLPSPSPAGRIPVQPGPAGDGWGLAAALDSAAAGDTLVLDAGLYRGSFTLRRGVSILGRAGPDSTVLDADGARYVLFGRGLDSTTVIAGLTLQNGRRDHPNSGGGGIYLHRSSPVILNNVFRDHLGYLGPGVYANYDCHAVVAFNVFHDNEGYLGGAVAAYQDCDLLVYNNIVFRNRAVSGGGLLCLNSAPVVVHNSFADNRAEPGGGGAIYCDSSPALIADNVLAYNRDPQREGGAVYWIDADRPAILRGNLLWDNEGGESGGACPPFAGQDGNCIGDPGFAARAAGVPARADTAGSCRPQAGARPWDRGSMPHVPDSVLTAWRAWRRAHARR